jgi:hypothetical protein
MILISRAVLSATTWRARAIETRRASCQWLPMSWSCVCEEARAAAVDLTVVSLFSAVPGTNVKSNTALESYIFQWFCGFLFRN